MSDERPLKFNANGKYNLDFIDYQNEYENIMEADYDFQNAPQKSPIYGISAEKFHELMMKDSIEFRMEQDDLQKQLFGLGVDLACIKKMKIGQTDKDCAVCLKKFTKGEVIRLLKCKHIFHDSCIVPWFESKSCCPLCRADQKQES